jgi:hypothetical protein
MCQIAESSIKLLGSAIVTPPFEGVSRANGSAKVSLKAPELGLWKRWNAAPEWGGDELSDSDRVRATAVDAHV